MITLKQARKNAGLKMDDVAKTLGISAPSSSKYETGQSPIPSHKLLSLCELYGVETVDLKLHREGEKIFADPHRPHTPFIEIAQDTGEIDDRVCLYYVIDRIEDILSYNSCQLDDTGSEVRDCTRKDMLEEFKSELIYNLGVNQRIRNNG